MKIKERQKIRLKNNDMLENCREVKTYLFTIEISRIERRLRTLMQDIELVMHESYSNYRSGLIYVPYSDLRETEKFRIRCEIFSDFIQPYIRAYQDKDVI